MRNKIFYIQWTNNFGGLEKITQLYLTKFSKYNPQVVPIRYNKSGLNYNNTYRFKNKDRFFFLIEYFLFVRKRRESIFHVQYAGNLILFITFLAGAKKIVYHFHGTKFTVNLFDRIIWRFVKKKIKIIANSKYTKKVIRDKLGINTDVFVIANLINTSEFVYNKRNYTGGKFIVTYAGRFTKGKNLSLLLDAIKQIESYKKLEDFEFRLYGEGPDKINIVNKLVRLKLNNTVKIFPFEEKINKIYQESHLFIFISLYESFGNVAAEAILTGLPVICYKIPSLMEFINNDYFFIEELNPKVIASKIIHIRENYTEVINRIEFVYKSVISYLDNERIINKLDKIYELIETTEKTNGNA